MNTSKYDEYTEMVVKIDNKAKNILIIIIDSDGIERSTYKIPSKMINEIMNMEDK